MAKIDFWMAGTGNWQNYLFSEDDHNLYRRIYTVESTIADFTSDELSIISRWENVRFIRKQQERIIAQIPIFTVTDKELFVQLLSVIAKKSHAVLVPIWPELVKISTSISSETRSNLPSILLIILYAYILDLGTLFQIQSDYIPQPPTRGDSGKYYLFGKDINVARNNFGIRGNGFLRDSMFWYIHGLYKQTINKQNSIQIPIFDTKRMEMIRSFCNPISKNLADIFSANIPQMKQQIEVSSFRNCSIDDSICLLFHIGYPMILDLIIEQKQITHFNEQVEDSIGMWITKI